MKRTLLVVAVLGGIASVANFAYQILAASRLDPAAFGLFAALMTFIVAIGAGASGFQVVTARAVSTGQDWSESPRLFDKTTLDAFLVSAALMVLTFLASPAISSALRVSVSTVLIIASFIPISVLQALAIGKIQGSGAVRSVAWIGLSLAVLKFLAGALVLALGGGAVGLVLSLLVTNGLVLVVISRRARRCGRVTAQLWSGRTWILVIAQTSFWAFVSLDLLIPRVALPDQQAGTFAAAATLAKMVLFLPGLLTTAILPWAGKLFGESGDRRRLAFISLSISLFVSVFAALALSVFAQPIVHLLFGVEYSSSATYVPALAFAYVPIALSTVLLQFHFTSDRIVYALTSLMTFLIALLLVTLGPAEPFYYVLVIGVTGAVQFVAYLVERFIQPSRVVGLIEGQTK